MKKFIFVIFILLVTVSAWSQVQPTATGDPGPIDEETQMLTPPLVTGIMYPNVVGAEDRSNYLSTSVTATESYIDNILPSSSVKAIADYSTSILPSITLDRKVSRQQETLNYSPAFTFYKDTKGLNAMDQSATGTYQARLSPHISIILQDFFLKTSNVFNTQFPFTGGGLGGATQTPVPAVIVPFAEQLRNVANGDVTYQISSKGMIGGGGEFSTYRFPNSAQAPGLYNSDSYGGVAFMNRRLSRTQYVGLMYEYGRILTYPANSKVQSQINTALPFYMLSFKRNFSLSVAAGVERADVTAEHRPTYRSWSPDVIASFGWQGDRANFAASYLHTDIAGQGLIGAFHTNNANASAGIKIAHTWDVEAAFSYQSTSVVSPLIALGYGGGNTETGLVSLEKKFGDHFTLMGGYNRLHSEYNGLAVIAANPDSNREFVTVTYRLTKPLGR